MTHTKNATSFKKGYTPSLETRRKMSSSKIGNKNVFGKRWSWTDESKINAIGKNKGDRNGMFGRRDGVKLNSLKRQILERDCYTCQICGVDDKDVLTIDHKIPKSVDETLFEEISNLWTLCANCHLKKTKNEIRTRVYGRGATVKGR